MSGITNGWQGYTFAQILASNVFSITTPAYATRVTFLAACKFDSLYMGQIDPNLVNTATVFHQLQFWVDQDTFAYIANDPNHTATNGVVSGKVVASRDDQGNFIPVVSEPLAIGFDTTNGVIISGYLDPSGGGILAVEPESDPWGFTAMFVDIQYDPITGALILNDTAANIDKSLYTFAPPAGSAAVVSIEGLYDPKQVPSGVPTSAT